MDALNEFKNHLTANNKTIQDITCCLIYISPDWNSTDILIDSESGDISLKDITRLNVDYDPGYGDQELFGFIKYSDGTWSERGEYYGSEWWEYKAAPEYQKIKEELL